MKKSIWIVTAATLAVAGTIALGGAHGQKWLDEDGGGCQWGQTQEARGGMGMDFVAGRILKHLELASGQQKQVGQILAAYRNAILQNVEAMLSARQAVFSAIHAEHFDEMAIRQACRAASAADEEQAVLRAKVAHEIEAVLNPEQVKRLHGIRDRFMERIPKNREFREGQLDKLIQKLQAG